MRPTALRIIELPVYRVDGTATQDRPALANQMTPSLKRKGVASLSPDGVVAADHSRA